MMGSPRYGRCSCPCPAPLQNEPIWPEFSIGTWAVDTDSDVQQQSLQLPTPTYFTYSKSHGSNDSGVASSSPVSPIGEERNSFKYNANLSTRKDCFSRNCDIIADTLNQLTLRESRSPHGYSTQLDISTESSMVSTRYSRWSGIATELESWERRLSAGWSNGHIPRAHVNSFVEFLRRLRQVVRRKSEEGLDLCAFCRNNGEPFEVYISHKVRNPSGQVTCPILRLLSCPLCKSTGDQAHTIKYCPYRRKSSNSP